jgi:hypothetical protein
MEPELVSAVENKRPSEARDADKKDLGDNVDLF